ncbi:MAG: hypothetical protein KJN90_02845 [Gammaproteobacteria bacterium]|nr:hypothetical protein [Gammaproteobacteria bacterium]
MLIEIREDPDAKPIYSTTVQGSGLDHDPDLEELYSLAWQEAIEAGVVPADADIQDYFLKSL